MWMLARYPLGRRRGVVTILATVALLAFFLLWQRSSWVEPLVPTHSVSAQQIRLWQYLHSQLEEHAPQAPQPTLIRPIGDLRFNAVLDQPRPNLIANADELLEPMQRAHDGFVEAIRRPINRPYLAGTRGIVTSAGGDYLPSFLVTLRMIRRTGSTLPVEVFLNQWDEYEPYICEVVLPPLNARCRVIEEVVSNSGESHRSIDIQHFQIKSIAMLFSSFETFIWLDADCVPLYDPAILLDSAPFTLTGLVSWPDFWAETVSPLYLNISRQPELPMTARQATESGLLMMSKKRHFLSLLLAVYYNYYGPDRYYEILSQGGVGAGDKDTFLHAARALGEDYYAVSERVLDLGHPAPDGGVLGSAMLHFDPVQDYALTSQGKWRVKDSSVAKPPRPFFVHANNPKFNAGHELLKGRKADNQRGKHGRLWTDSKEALQLIGFDVEKMMWEETKAVTCNLEHAFFSWQKKTGLCESVQSRWTATFEDPSVETPKFTQDPKDEKQAVSA